MVIWEIFFSVTTRLTVLVASPSPDKVIAASSRVFLWVVIIIRSVALCNKIVTLCKTRRIW